MESGRKGRGRGTNVFIWESRKQSHVIENDVSDITPKQYNFMFWIIPFYWNPIVIFNNMIPRSVHINLSKKSSPSLNFRGGKSNLIIKLLQLLLFWTIVGRIMPAFQKCPFSKPPNLLICYLTRENVIFKCE